MTVHFAAARSPATSPVARILSRPQLGAAANDNGKAVGDDHMLHAALRHFADHGLAAARMARSQAEAAFFAGERDSYDWWRGICRALDRRLAEDLSRALEPGQAV